MQDLDAIIHRIDKYWWPKYDEKCHKVVLKQLKDIKASFPWVRKFDCAIQAGGNVGIWPIELSKHFKNIWTFEPDPINWDCLVRNLDIKYPNIHAYNSALTLDGHDTSMSIWPKNCGANFIDAKGKIRVGGTRLDDWDFEPDLIILDIEGYEALALEGAKKILESHHPVLHLEDKGLSEKYGTSKGYLEKWLARNFKYRVVARVNRDIILA